MSREQIVEKRRSDPSDVEVAGRTGGKSNANPVVAHDVFRSYPIQTVFTLTNSRIPKPESSRPNPESLTPPNGSLGSDLTIPLTNTEPASTKGTPLVAAAASMLVPTTVDADHHWSVARFRRVVTSAPAVVLFGARFG